MLSVISAPFNERFSSVLYLTNMPLETASSARRELAKPDALLDLAGDSVINRNSFHLRMHA